MKTQAAVLLLGTVLMLIAHFVRCSSGLRRPVVWLAGALLAFVSMQAAILITLECTDSGRDTSFGRVVAGIDPQPGRPILVLLGSSLTARNVDGKLVQEILSRSGVNIEVIQLSWPGGYAFEQDYYLSRFLRTKNSDVIVLAELGTEPAWRVSRENVFKHDSIGYHDLLRVIDKIKVAISEDEIELAAIVEVAKHGLAHHANIGLAHAFFLGGRQEQRSGFLPEPKLPDAPPYEDILAGLETADVKVELPAVFLSYAREREKNWKLQGVSHVFFWQPPNADPERRGWMRELCSALQSDCLPFDGVKQMSGPFWNDKGHLTDVGARRFTEWFSRKLLEWKDLRDVL